MLTKKVRIANYSIPLVLLLIIVVAVALAVGYVVYQFSIQITVEQYPKVTFWDWSTSQKKNSFSYSVRIFPNIKTIDQNMTFGLYCDDISNHVCYLRIGNAINPDSIDGLNITIYDSTGTIFTKEWTNLSSTPTDWEPFTVAAGKKYTIWMEITASSGASGSSTITIDMKVESP